MRPPPPPPPPPDEAPPRRENCTHSWERRGRRYSSWASSTCSCPSLVRARMAKMSRIRAVRSTIFKRRAFSRLRCCEGVSSSSKMTRLAPVSWTRARSSSTFPLPRKVAEFGAVEALGQGAHHLGPGRPGQLLQLGQGIGGAQGGPASDGGRARRRSAPSGAGRPYGALGALPSRLRAEGGAGRPPPARPARRRAVGMVPLSRPESPGGPWRRSRRRLRPSPPPSRCGYGIVVLPRCSLYNSGSP